MTEFWFVRHAVTEDNLTHRMIGISNPVLHPLGQAQARHLAARLRENTFDRIVSSPLSRALETAAAIAQNHRHLTVETMDALAEVHLGIVDGMNSFEAYEMYQSLMDQALLEQENDFAFPGGESRIHAQRRMSLALEQLVRETPQGRICVVTHGGVLGFWRCALEGAPLGAFRRFQPSHGSVSHVRMEFGQPPEIVEWSADAHQPLTLRDAIQNARRRQP